VTSGTLARCRERAATQQLAQLAQRLAQSARQVAAEQTLAARAGSEELASMRRQRLVAEGLAV
jgi:hypothetical protein